MTDKELRKLSRKDLVEMLYYMREEIDDLTAENKKLNERLDLLIGKVSENTEQLSEEITDE